MKRAGFTASRSCTAVRAAPTRACAIDPVEQARRIREAEQNDPMLKGRTILGVADPAIFDESRGESIAAMMERGPHFLHWVPGDHTRLAGKMQFHYRLAFDGEGRPMFQVFSTCRHFIRTLRTWSMTRAMWRTSTPGRRTISMTSAAMC